MKKLFAFFSFLTTVLVLNANTPLYTRDGIELYQSITKEKNIFCSVLNKNIIVWNTSNWTEINKIKAHDSEILSLAFSPDGKYLATSSSDSKIKIWNTSTWATIAMFDKAGIAKTIAFSPDGKFFAAGTTSKDIKIWFTNSWEQETLSGHQENVETISFSPDSRYLVSGSYDKNIKMWELSF